MSRIRGKSCGRNSLGRFCREILCSAAIFFASALLLSCQSSLKIEIRQDSAVFSYSVQTGAAFLEAISAIRGNFESAGDGFGALFDEKELRSMFQEAGFENVSVGIRSKKEASGESRPSASKKSEIEISGQFPESRHDAVEDAGMLRREFKNLPSEQPGATLAITAETLRGLYDALPISLRSYLDLFMAPSFSGEEMSDAEYLDLIATVYGSALSDEMSCAGIALSLASPRGRKSVKIPLLRLLNFTEPIVLGV